MKNGNPDFIIKKEMHNSAGVEMVTLRRYKGHDSVVNVPDGVQRIVGHVFADDIEPNKTIQKIILPDSVTDIDPTAFSYCLALNEIKFSQKMTNFDLFLENCPSLKEICVPESVERFGGFGRNGVYQNVHLGSNITRINFTSNAWDTPQNLARIRQGLARTLLQNPAYRIIDGFVINEKEKSVLFRLDYNHSKLRVPNGMEIIGSGAFFEWNLDHDQLPLEELEIPASVTLIHDLAFYSCNSLKRIVYKGNCGDMRIGQMPFFMCNFSRTGSEVICADRCDKKEKPFKPTSLKIERVFYIHKRFKSGARLNKNGLIKELKEHFALDELGIATVGRDLDLLRDRFYAPLEYDPSQKVFYYTDTSFTLEGKEV